MQLIKLKQKIKKNQNNSEKTRRFLHVGPSKCAPHTFRRLSHLQNDKFTHSPLRARDKLARTFDPAGSLLWLVDAPIGTMSRLLCPQTSSSVSSAPKPVASAIETSFAAAIIASSAFFAAARSHATFENSPCSMWRIHLKEPCY